MKKGPERSAPALVRLRSQEERREAEPGKGGDPVPPSLRSVIVGPLAVLVDVEALGLDFRARTKPDRVLEQQEQHR